MIRNAITLLRGYTTWVSRLPQATGAMFAARSPVGRSVKIFLFGVGAVLPLGSVIWALLYWHGNGLGRHRYAEMNYSNQVAERLDGVSQGTNPAAVSS